MSTWDVAYTVTTVRKYYQVIEADSADDALQEARSLRDWVDGETSSTRTLPVAVRI